MPIDQLNAASIMDDDMSTEKSAGSFLNYAMHSNFNTTVKKYIPNFCN
jgi:hypothetical protein